MGSRHAPPAQPVPSEKGLLSHVQFIRELLDCGVLKALLWIDTRDMFADGLTKGSIDREALHKLMDGFMEFKCNESNVGWKLWKSNLTASTEKLVQQADIVKC